MSDFNDFLQKLANESGSTDDDAEMDDFPEEDLEPVETPSARRPRTLRASQKDEDFNMFNDDDDLIDDSDEDDSDEDDDDDDLFLQSSSKRGKRSSGRQVAKKAPPRRIEEDLEEFDDNDDLEDADFDDDDDDDFDEDEDEVITSGMKLGKSKRGKASPKTKKKPKQRSAKRKANDDYDDYLSDDEDDEDDYDDDDYIGGDDEDPKIGKGGMIGRVIIIIAVALALIAVITVAKKAQKKATFGEGDQKVELQKVESSAAVEVAEKESEKVKADLQASEQAKKDKNQGNFAATGIERGKLMTNTSITFDPEVYQDTININKFIEWKGGVIIPKFVGTAKHLGKDVEFTVSLDDYNKYVNGVELTILYKVVSFDGQTNVADIMLAPGLADQQN